LDNRRSTVLRFNTEATIHPSDCYRRKTNVLHTTSSAEWDLTMNGIRFLDYIIYDNEHLFLIT
jgi:hypothetical protein